MRGYPQKWKNCKLSSCFKFKKCPYDREFTAHIYKPYNSGRSVGGNSVTEVYNILKSMPYVNEVNEPIACVYVVIIDPSLLKNSSKLLENVLHNLTFWQGDGHNQIVPKKLYIVNSSIFCNAIKKIHDKISCDMHFK